MWRVENIKKSHRYPKFVANIIDIIISVERRDSSPQFISPNRVKEHIICADKVDNTRGVLFTNINIDDDGSDTHGLLNGNSSGTRHNGKRTDRLESW